MLACSQGHSHTVDLILNSQKADMDITDNDGNTALHHCFQAQSQAIFGYNYPLLPSHFESALNLIKKGADIDMENHDCDTALDFVEENTSDIFECNSPLSLSFLFSLFLFSFSKTKL